MNLFCFTLAGSTESLYEPAHTKTLKEVLPMYQCSPALLKCGPERAGSDPCITTNTTQSALRSKKNSKRSCLPTSPFDSETLETHFHHVCWKSSCDQRDSSRNNVQNRGKSEAPCQSSALMAEDREKELNSEGPHTDPPAQGREAAADTAESGHTKRKLKKFQSLVQAKKGHQSGAGKGKSVCEGNDALADALHDNPVLTCIGLGKRTEKSPDSAPPTRQQRAREHRGEEATWGPRVGSYLWSPFECPQPWPPFHHTCHQAPHELRVCGGTLPLPRPTEWDRFESLVQEVDNKRPKPPPPQMIHSITDLHLSQNTLSRFGRLDAATRHSPVTELQDDRGCLPKQRQRNEAPTEPKPREEHMEASTESDRTPPQRHQTARQKTETPRAADGRHRRPSLESLYSLNSGQSSSSGVTSGSDCSSNRGSLRLEEELPCTSQFCGRARVHTDHVPSPYDTESLKLKVGDVINIVAKPPMGIWRGMLNGSVGNFKFIYVDVLREESPEKHKETQSHKERHRSTVQEVLKEYCTPLQLNGYQTVEDLMRLREHHLTELNVTDPEHRRRLLDSLQQLRSDHRVKKKEANQEAENPGENAQAEMTNGSRDSGCPENTAEEADLHAPCQQPPSAEISAS